MTLYILKYNNYYNRLVKYENSMEAYEPYITYTLQSTNFNPADGVDTTHVFGVGEYDGTGDYLIAYDNNEIVSRWFIIDSIRTRAGQYQLTLHRDLVVDYYNVIKESPMFIEKATINSSTDPFIFNSENMTYNQILKSQTLLQDETKTPWIVGYIPRNSFTTDTKVSVQQYVDDAVADYRVSGLNNWEFWDYVRGQNTNSTTFNVMESCNYHIFTQITEGSASSNTTYRVKTTVDINGSYVSTTYKANEQAHLILDKRVSDRAKSNAITKAMVKKYATAENRARLKSYASTYSGWKTTEDEAALLETNGKILYDSEAKLFYKISVNRVDSYPINNYPIQYGSALSDLMYELLTLHFIVDTEYAITGTPYNSTFFMSFDGPYYEIKLEQLSDEISVTIAANRYKAVDSPYDIFCIPYLPTDVYVNGVKQFTTQTNAATALAQEIASKVGSAAIYDIQLLPYCPIRQVVRSINSGGIDVGSYIHSYITNSSDNPISIILWCTSSSFNFNIPFNVEFPDSVLETKIKSETEFLRLCSPNYSGIFEFNAVKNGGVQNIQVDCTYKPFSPFIHLRPNFGNLYGINPQKDSRGLICGGDFSLAQTSNAWANYELNNKNYQAMFDRQIQSMELKNSIQREQDIASAVFGSFSGAAGGAIAGSLGGPIGAAIGGVVGFGASLAGGLLDYEYNEKLRNEALDYTKDMYGYNLGNIKALPNSLSKTSALTFNNKLFPFIESYSCSEAEKEALKAKLKYNGMTVMKIATMDEFIQADPSYIKGKLIRLQGIDEDYHLVNAISGELNKGVFI